MYNRSSFKASLCTAAVMGAAAGGYVAPTEAQESVGERTGIQEVIVTARRREESQQEVPVAVTALSGEALRQASVNTLEDLRFQAPALNVSPSTFGTSVPGYTIRGQRQSSNIASQDTSALVYFADQAMARAHGTNSTMYDLESAQVLKGPQGTLFGRSTTGGAVLLNPMKPSFQSGVQGEFTGEVGDYSLYGGAGFVNVGVSDTFAVRLAGKFTRRDGYVDSLFDNQEFEDENSDSWRVGLRWQPTENIESYTVYQHFKQKNAGSAWKLTGVNPVSTVAALQPDVLGRMQAQLAQLEASDFHTVATDLDGFEDTDAYSISNTTTWQVGGVTLKNIVGYRSVTSEHSLDYDGTNVQWNAFQLGPVLVPAAQSFGVFNSLHAVDADQVTEEFQVLGTAFDERLDWIAGLYYFTEEAHDYQLSELVGRRTNDGVAKNESWSVFLQGAYKLPWLEGLSLTAGARYTWDERELEQRNQIQSFTASALTCRLTNTGPGDAQIPLDPCSRTSEFSDSAPTWTVGLDYQINDQLLVYLAHRRGYRSGGLQLYTSRSEETPTFDPEFVDDYEVGVKSTWYLGDTALRLNAALYRQDYEDIQRTLSFADPTINGALTTSVVNAASATIDGGELEVTLIPRDFFELSGFVGYVDAQYDKFVNTRSNPPTVLTDNEFAWVPEITAGVTMRVRLPFNPSLGEIWVQGNWYTQDEQEMSDINDSPGTGLGQLNAYELFNAAVSWSGVLGNPNVDARLAVKNVKDTEYYSTGLATYGTTGFTSRLMGPPRTVAAEITYRFGE